MQEKKRDIKRNIKGKKTELEVERGGKPARKEIGREGQDPERRRGVETEEGRGTGKAEIERREEKTASNMNEKTEKEGRTASDPRWTRAERAETGTREMTGARLERRKQDHLRIQGSWEEGRRSCHFQLKSPAS